MTIANQSRPLPPFITRGYADSLTNVFIVDSTVRDSGRVFTAWSLALAAAIAASPGPSVVYHRDFAPVMAAAVYDVGPDPLLLTGVGDDDTTLTIANGASFSGGLITLTTENLSLRYLGVGVPGLTITGDGNIRIFNGEWRCTGGHAFLRCTNGGFNDCQVELGGTAGGAVVIEALGGAFFEFQCSGNSHVGINTLSDGGGAGAMSANLNSSAVGGVALPQAGLAGGVLDVFYASSTRFIQGPGSGTPAIQAGVVTLGGTGKSGAIAATITANSRIKCGLKNPGGAGAATTTQYAALAADRVIGSPGSFKVTALVTSSGGANANDTSDVDWIVEN